MSGLPSAESSAPNSPTKSGIPADYVKVPRRPSGGSGKGPAAAAVTAKPHNHNRTMKTRLFSMWNNAVNTQYFKPKFSPDSPVWVLGELYGQRTLAEAEQGGQGAAAVETGHGQSANDDADHIIDALDDIGSRLWLSYREGFTMIPGSKYTSDVGWGCMIRSGQMLLAQALLMNTVGRGFRLNQGSDQQYDALVKLFYDTTATDSPFSLHNLLRIGERYGVKPGTWLGPSIVCTAMSRALNELTPHPVYGALVAYVALDCLVSKSEIMRVITAGGHDFRAVLILIPLRLGVERLNPLYIPSLQNIFSYQECVGLIGGKSGHSMYFLGFQGNEMIGLDPHICQMCPDFSAPSVPNESFQCRSPRKVKLNAVDPSLAIGFVCRTPAELERFYRLSEQDADGRMTPLYSIQA